MTATRLQSGIWPEVLTAIDDKTDALMFELELKSATRLVARATPAAGLRSRAARRGFALGNALQRVAASARSPAKSAGPGQLVLDP